MAEEQREAMEQQAAAPVSSLLDEIIEASKIKPTDEGYDVTRAGLQEFIREIASSGTTPKVSGALVDAMIVELDKKLSDQVNEIMHNEQFRELESSWRSLKFLVDNVDFRQNTKVEILNVSKQDLIDDFEDAPEVVKSGLYKHIYTSEFGQFGGQPVGAVISNYTFGPGPQDMELLRNVASVSAMSHVPFLGAAGKEFFGIDSWDQLPNLKDLHSIFEMPQYAKWRSLRENEDSRYLGLTLPRFLLRLPYGENTTPAKNFNFTETVGDNEDFCWGNTSFALASRMADSFAKYRWCSNIIGPQSGGAVENLPLYQFEQSGEIQTKIPTEVLISERREYELAEEGFIALTMRKGSDNAAFFSANSVLRPKVFPNTPEGKEAEMNYKLSTALYDDNEPPRALHQGHPAREHRRLEGARRHRARAERMDKPVRHGDGQPRCNHAQQAPAPHGEGAGQRRAWRSRLVFRQSASPSALQIHGRELHALAGRKAGQAVKTAI